MQLVAQKLHAIGCAVSTINLAIFGEQLPDKADAADAEQFGITPDTIAPH